MSYPRVITPIKYQREASECAAVALWIILAYYKKYVPIKEIRERCNVSRGGTSAIDYIKAARSYGFIAKAHKRGTIEALREIKPPFSLYYNYNHSIVVEGLDEDSIYINEGGRGRQRLSLESFDDSFTGLVYTFVPSENFKQEGSKLDFTALIDLWQFFQAQKGLVGITLLFALLFGLLSSLGLAGVLASLAKTSPISINSIAGILALGGLALLLKNSFLQKSAQKLLAQREQFFNRYFFELPMNYFYQNGFLTASMFRHVNQYLSQHLPLFLTKHFILISWAIASLCLLFIESTILGGLGFLLLLLFAIVRSKLWTKNTAQYQDPFLHYDFGGQDFPKYAQSIKRYKLTEKGKGFAFAHLSGLLYELDLSKEFYENTNTLRFLLLTSLIGYVPIAAAWAWFGQLPLPALGYLLGVASLYSWTLYQLSESLESLQTDYGMLSEINRIFEQYPPQLTTDTSKHLDIKQLLEEQTLLLAMKNIAYDFAKGKEPVLKNFNLTMQQGEFVGVLGKSGAGKSIISQLLISLHEPTEGEIRLLGQALGDFNPLQKKQLIGLVMQEARLFKGTLRENLTLWEQGISDERLQEALRLACVSQEMSNLDRLVQSEGKNFNRSQQQQLEIARALVHQPKLLMMDEATNAIDVKLTKQILQNIRQLGLACLFITHQPETLEGFDKTMVLQPPDIPKKHKLFQS